MSGFSPSDYVGPNYTGLLSQEVIDGANYVELGSLAQIDLTTGAISDAIISSSNGSTNDETVNFSTIGPAIAVAEAQGLNVMLKPQIGAFDPNVPGGFGNLTDPNEVIANPAAFFSSYETYILQWAKLAQQYNVPILSIGNEMLAATKPQYTAYWDQIIAAVREVYSGQLTYSALLPLQTNYTAGNEVAQIQFWNKLDFAGFDVYPTLTNLTDPTVAQLNAAWQSEVVNSTSQDYVQFVTQLAQSIGKPVIFTETGVASFPGAADRWDYNDAIIGQATTQSDGSLQANWWQSFFDTWAVNPPSWLSGIFLWDNDPGNTSGSSYYTNGYNIDGKPAELVVSSWFGGKDYLSVSQSAFTGSQSNDRIVLSGGNAIPSGQSITRLATYKTVVYVTLDGTIINGQSPTVHFYINGVDYGAQTLSNTPSSYMDAQGVSWSADQTFTFTLSGAVSVNQLKVGIDSQVNVGGVENSQTYIASASINGVASTQETYNPLNGSLQTGAMTQIGQYDGGYTLIDPTPWNTALASNTIGTATNPILVNGGGGTDTVYVLGALSQYTVSNSGGVITLSESSGLNQNAVLTNVAQVAFSDITLVFDLHSAEDTLVYELYQAAFARTPDNPGFRYWATVGDSNNLSAITLADAFLAAPEFTQKYGSNPSNTAYVTALYSNVLGRPPRRCRPSVLDRSSECG